MKTIAVIGNSSVVPELESIVKEKVNELINENQIITGGATGVDTFVIESILEKDLTERLTIYLTDPVEEIKQTYQWKKKYGDNEKLKKELERSKKAVQKFIELQPGNVFENLGDNRNKNLAQEADEVIAFMSKESKGTMQTIAFAKEIGKRVTVLNESGEEIQLSEFPSNPS